MNPFEKKTKIIATLGPSTNSQDIIEQLVQKGVNVFRLNFSHGTHIEHEGYISAVRSARYETGQKPAIMADLQGPKIRTGVTENNLPVKLVKGSNVALTPEPVTCTENIISIDYPSLHDELSEKDHVLINDGTIGLSVESIDRTAKLIHCRILNTGLYSSHKGVHFPHANLNLPAVTEKDRRDLSFILSHDIDFVALSFVKRAEDLMELRDIINRNSESVRIIAKIEKPEAAECIDSLLEHCEGIMVARGDLGVEASVKIIPLVQKDLITKANSRGKTVIVATQMLESMIEHITPTRAEVTDIANAILDRTDAVMLSGETAVGKYPVEAVDLMSQIILATEESSYYPRDFIAVYEKNRESPNAICHASAMASRDLGNIPIIIFTLSGETAWHISNIRPQAPLIAFSSSDTVIRQLSLAWNTIAFHIPYEGNIVKLINMAEERLIEENIMNLHDRIVIVSGTTSVKGATNFMRIKKIGEF